MDTPPPLPPDARPVAHTSTWRRVWPWTLVVLVVLLSLAVNHCVRRCTEGVMHVGKELAQYTTDPNTRWLRLPIHEADDLLAGSAADPRGMKAEHLDRRILVHGEAWRVAWSPDGSALVTLRSERGVVQAQVDAGYDAAHAWLRTRDPGSPEAWSAEGVTLAGFVDWMNRRTIHLREAWVLDGWPPAAEKLAR